MKKVILSLLLLPIISSSQSFNVFDIDTSEYPIMKAKFYSIDENGEQILNHTTSDFEITENGNTAEVLSISCPELLPIPISVGIMVDTYRKINLARHGTERFVNFLKMPQNELAITYMNGRPLLFQDFTKDKQKARNISKQVPPASGGTKVSEMFFDEYAGGIELIKNREAQNRVLIFVSDLHCPNLSIDEQELIQQAKDNNIRIYTVLINSSDYTGLFTRIADNTNGVVFENVRDSSEIEDVFKDILFKEQDDPCEIGWRSTLTCEKSLNLEILNRNTNLILELNQELSPYQYLYLDIDKIFINFGTTSTDTTIIVSAKNGTQTINDIAFEPDNGDYQIVTSLPATIPSNGSVEIKLKYTVADDLREYTKMEILGDFCTTTIGLIKGDKNKPLSQRTLELTHPDGGEVFIAGSDTIITWGGISKGEQVSLEFSGNLGKSWENISTQAVGFEYRWGIPIIASDSCQIRVKQRDYASNKEIGEIIWQKSYGGGYYDGANSIQQTLDGGYIIAGYIQSLDYNIDYWILKLKSDGSIDWQKSYGGSDDDRATSIQQTQDGGYIVAGTSKSEDGDILDAKGADDFWILKLNSDGSLDWQKSYGGSENDVANSIQQTQDGGYIIAGGILSQDGDITDAKGNYDIWILRLKPDGSLDWQKSYGGSGIDQAQSIQQTRDGSYIVAGYSLSQDGDITDAKGSDDIWILKLNLDGSIDWQKSYGGSDNEVANSIQQTQDGGYIVAGTSKSDDGDILDAKGDFDFWILKIKSDGSIDWQKSYGGSDDDRATSIQQTQDGGYIVAGHSKSDDGDILDAKGDFDIWILKLKSDGSIDWQKSYGGSNRDFVTSVKKTYAGSYIIAGHSNSQDGDITDSKGSLDHWIVKIAGPPKILQSDTSDAVFSIIMPEPVIQNNDIDMGQMIVGSTKDTIVSSVICNVGDAPLHVLGVDITDAFDSEDFLIPRGAGDFYLEKDSCQDMMFEFTPSALGNRTAVATIRTTIGDFTDTIRIRGVGINPVIEATSDVVDFGVFELGNGKDTNVVLVKNVGSTDITITDTRISGPDMEQFTLFTNPVSYTIAVGDEKEFALNYTAKYGGRTSSILEFHYDGIGSPLRSMLFAEGVGGEVYPEVPDAYVGETVQLGIFLGKIKPEGLSEVATNYSATVSYNSTLLAPIDKSMNVSTIDNKSYISITTGQLSGVPQIATIPMKVGLGNADRSGLVITEFQLYDANGDSVDYDIEPGVGEFNVLGICDEGGQRLLNPDGEATLLKLLPNRTSGQTTVEMTLIESGQTELTIFDQIGNKIETVYSGNPEIGTQEITLDLSQYVNGRYYIKLTTPTITKTEILEVIK